MTAPVEPLVPVRRRVPSTTMHMVGLALTFAAVGMFASLVVELAVSGTEVTALAASSVVLAGLGLLLWRGSRVPARVSAASTFAAVSWTWIGVSLAGALPYLLSGALPALDDAWFESVSGFTATGSTVLSPIEGTSRGILFWRQLTQWYGGMGFIVLAVAVLPFLGVGGLDLLRTEAPGEESDRLAPRVSETAKRLWLIYVALTLLIATALLVVGLSPYDAVAHSLTTAATGGFSPYNDSILHFDSLAVELVLEVGMILGAVSFTLHWRAVNGDWRGYLRSAELRLFLAVLVSATAIVTLLNVVDGGTIGRSLRDSLFSVVAMATTTGFGTADFAQWVPAAQVVLLYFMITGAMAGSTSGGMKLFRVQVMARHALRELRWARRPQAVLPIKLGAEAVPESIVARIVGFVILYAVIAVAGVLVLSGLGADLETSVGAVATTMGNGGPGLGDAGPASNFLVFTRPARVLLSVLMLFGRLELFPMLLMFAAARRSVRRRPGR